MKRNNHLRKSLVAMILCLLLAVPSFSMAAAEQSSSRQMEITLRGKTAVYEDSDFAAEVLDTLPDNAKLALIMVNGDWAKVRLDETTCGFVHKTSVYDTELFALNAEAEAEEVEEAETEEEAAEVEEVEEAETEEEAAEIEEIAEAEIEEEAAETEEEAAEVEAVEEVEIEEEVTETEEVEEAETEEEATEIEEIEEAETEEEPAEIEEIAEAEIEEEAAEIEEIAEAEIEEEPAEIEEIAEAENEAFEEIETEESEIESPVEEEIADYETPLGENDYQVITLASIEKEIPVRQSADGLSPIFTTLSEGDKIIVLAVKGNWVAVLVSGQVGYVYIDDVADLMDLPQQEENAEPEMKVTIFTSRRTVMTVGEPVYLTSKLEGFENCEEILYVWKVDKGNGFEVVEGAHDATYTFAADAESLTWGWMLTVLYR